MLSIIDSFYPKTDGIVDKTTCIKNARSLNNGIQINPATEKVKISTIFQCVLTCETLQEHIYCFIIKLFVKNRIHFSIWFIWWPDSFFLFFLYNFSLIFKIICIILNYLFIYCSLLFLTTLINSIRLSESPYVNYLSLEILFILLKNRFKLPHSVIHCPRFARVIFFNYFYEMFFFSLKTFDIWLI